MWFEQGTVLYSVTWTSTVPPDPSGAGLRSVLVTVSVLVPLPSQLLQATLLSLLFEIGPAFIR